MLPLLHALWVSPPPPPPAPLSALSLGAAFAAIALSTALYAWTWLAPRGFAALVAPRDPCKTLAAVSGALKMVQFCVLGALVGWGASYWLPVWVDTAPKAAAAAGAPARRAPGGGAAVEEAEEPAAGVLVSPPPPSRKI